MLLTGNIDKQHQPIGVFFMDKYILKGKKAVPATTLEWAEWFEKAGKERIVKQEKLPDGKWVSTVFLGINHNFWQGKPLLFETMVFTSKDDLDEQDVNRYSTWEEALEGHKRMVKKWSD